jgi:hypothetical protein
MYEAAKIRYCELQDGNEVVITLKRKRNSDATEFHYKEKYYDVKIIEIDLT